MNKNKKIIIFVLIALLIIIPVSTLAISKLIVLPYVTEEDIEEASRLDTEKALEEKSKFAEEHKYDVMSQQDIQTEFSEEELQTFQNEKQEVENKENKIKEIMNRYYSEEFNEILNDIENNYNNQGVVDIKKDPIPTCEAKLYDIIMKVLEEKDLSDEDANVLKDFISQQKDTINKDSSLKVRADKILQ